MGCTSGLNWPGVQPIACAQDERREGRVWKVFMAMRSCKSLLLLAQDERRVWISPSARTTGGMGWGAFQAGDFFLELGYVAFQLGYLVEELEDDFDTG